MALLRIDGPEVEDRWFRWTGTSIIVLLLVSFVLMFRMPWERPLFPNSDFERGTLENWTASGAAFEDQPTFGDNPRFRTDVSSHLRGDWFVGTFEHRPSPNHPLRGVRGDEATGTLTSLEFKIEGDSIVFLLGGGDGTPATSVSLVVDGTTVLTASGNAATTRAESMRRVRWDVRPWKERSARIVVRDSATGSWGHVNVDDFLYGF